MLGKYISHSSSERIKAKNVHKQHTLKLTVFLAAVSEEECLVPEASVLCRIQHGNHQAVSRGERVVNTAGIESTVQSSFGQVKNTFEQFCCQDCGIH